MMETDRPSNLAKTNEPIESDHTRRDRWLVFVCVAGLVFFLVCIGVAIKLYPGGTWFDRRAEGHSFAKNFLCDLMQTRALNGVDAPVGSMLARIGSFVMFVALSSFYFQIANFESPVSRGGRIARNAGLLTCVLGCSVPFVTSDQFRHAHVIAVVGTFIPCLVAAIAAFVVCLRAPHVSRWLRAAALVTLGSGAVDGLGYAYDYLPAIGVDVAQPRMLPFALPLLQRVATLGLIVWMVAVCAHTWSVHRSQNSSTV